MLYTIEHIPPEQNTIHILGLNRSEMDLIKMSLENIKINIFQSNPTDISKTDLQKQMNNIINCNKLLNKISTVEMEISENENIY